jgi:hypothetical protein
MRAIASFPSLDASPRHPVQGYGGILYRLAEFAIRSAADYLMPVPRPPAGRLARGSNASGTTS